MIASVIEAMNDKSVDVNSIFYPKASKNGKT